MNVVLNIKFTKFLGTRNFREGWRKGHLQAPSPAWLFVLKDSKDNKRKSKG